MELISHVSSDGKNIVNIRLSKGNLKGAVASFEGTDYTLASVYQIAQQRVLFDSFEDNSKLVESYSDNHFLTSDSIVYNIDGRVKIILDLKNIKNTHNNHTLFNHPNSVLIPQEDFNKLDGLEFSKTEYEKYTNSLLTAYEINQNPIWNFLFREDRALLNEYENLLSRVDQENKRFFDKSENKRVLKMMPIKFGFYDDNSLKGTLVEKIIRFSSIWENYGGVYTLSNSDYKSEEDELYVPLLKAEDKEVKIVIPKSNLEHALHELISEGYVLDADSVGAKSILAKYII